MSLTPGAKLGPYEILALLGAGGMGEVYRARDTKLGREVAVKVIAEAFAQNEERLARFEREARVLASLNHPNVATLYGLEQSDGVQFLVMELAEGETLAERLRSGPIPAEDAIPIFKQIAEGLEAAHEKGIIHRDLKPANIKVSSEGKVKVLDFGLAKAMTGDQVKSELSESPTITRDATATGVILGTAAYMSPEQARGKPLDKRTDVWAFGCVFFESLTGRVVFLGETVSDTIAEILGKEPEWEALPASIPYAVRNLLRRCLRKDATRRLHDIADVRIELEDVFSEPSPAMSPAAVSRPARLKRIAPWALTAIVTALAVWTGLRSPPSSTEEATRFSIPLPPSEPVYEYPALSADGRRLAYVAGTGNSRRLYVRSMDELEATLIPGSEGAIDPFFSPDGEWVGFQAGQELKIVPIEGGASVILCRVDLQPLTADWGDDGMVYFTKKTVWRVSADGGEPEVMTELQEGEYRHRFPEVLPGGRAILLTLTDGDTMARGSYDHAKIAVLSLETGQRRILIDAGSFARYTSGHLVYSRGGSLLAVPFDSDRLEITGSPVPVLDGVRWNPGTGWASFTLSREGDLAYVPGGAAGQEPRSLLWVDRQGKASPITNDRAAFRSPYLSPDGQRLAMNINSQGNWDVWVYEMARGTLTRVTHTGGDEGGPKWTPDGEQLTYAYVVPLPVRIFWSPADGSSESEVLVESEYDRAPASWSNDGRALLFVETHPTTGQDIWVLEVEPERKTWPFLKTPFQERQAIFSPSGQWVAYVSDESGRDEVYVRPFPDSGRKWQVSTSGGSGPVWARDERELFYRNDRKMMAVEVQSGSVFTARAPKLLFEGSFELDSDRNYDVSPDATRFVMVEEPETPHTQINVALNWMEDVKGLVASQP